MLENLRRPGKMRNRDPRKTNVPAPRFLQAVRWSAFSSVQQWPHLETASRKTCQPIAPRQILKPRQ